MDAIDLLMVEHRHIALILDMLEEECRAAHGGQPVRRELVRRIAVFLEHHVDGSHQLKERALFRALAPHGLVTAPAIVRKIVDEHELTSEAAVRLRRIAEGEGDDDELIRASIGYVRHFRDHAAEEEAIVFPLARRLLNGKAKDELRSKIARIEAAHVPLAEAAHVIARAFPPAVA